MFQSGQLSLPGFEPQRQFMTAIVSIVIIASTLYYFAVLASEVYTMASAHSKRTAKASADDSTKKQVEMGRDIAVADIFS